ncbi:C2 domain-containing protein At1g53590 isoform X2 [Morus notabilis]|uniref:C2 domain-containing protein At1g53590 isoform X2 n=1 Tax=Morus notabilis TaxID=981085 RepID=UPI000CED50CA|nr:C2 domain-containing protein At1g53590 isoform X2 [Morus notabilis]
MDITQVSIIHHVGIVLLVLWLLAEVKYCHPVVYFLSLIYLYLVHERYVMRLRRKLQFEERRQANQRRVLSDSETVRWLNHAVEKIWPICMEQIASQKILLPIIPWFLEKYKPWTAVLELGMNFLTADDMSAILAVKLRKRLGFGMWAKLHLTGLHVEGKVLVGVKFLRDWPFIGRLRLCFVEPPYFQMTIKPIFSHGLDVTEVPGIAGWLDKLLSVAFEQTLVEPNMLVVDMEKFVSADQENWFSVDEKEPVAYAKIEVIEASDMKPSDLNGLADPYLKGQMGSYRFRTKIQKKTLSPKWHEEFKIPIITWELPNILALEVRDKDRFVDDILGDCSVNISDLRDGQRHDMWLPLQNIKTGRLHLAVTILEENVKADDHQGDWKSFHSEEKGNSFATETTNKGSFSSASSEKSQRVAEYFEPIDIEGQKETGIWVHQPGSDVSQTWEPRKGKCRHLDTKILKEPNDITGNSILTPSRSQNNDSSSSDENPDDKRSMSSVRRGIRKIGSVFHRSPKDGKSNSFTETIPSPHINIKAVDVKEIGVKFVVEEDLARPALDNIPKEEDSSYGESGPDSPSKGNMKDRAKSLFKHAEKSAQTLKHMLSRKGGRRSQGNSPVTERDIAVDYDDSSDDESLPSSKVERIPSIPIPSEGIVLGCGNDSSSSQDHVVDPVVQAGETDTAVDAKSPKNKVSPRGLEMLHDKEGSPVNKSDVESPKMKLDEGGDLEGPTN